MTRPTREPVIHHIIGHGPVYVINSVTMQTREGFTAPLFSCGVDPVWTRGSKLGSEHIEEVTCRNCLRRRRT